MQDTVKLPAESLMPGRLTVGGETKGGGRRNGLCPLRAPGPLAAGYLSCLLVYEIQHCYLAPPGSSGNVWQSAFARYVPIAPPVTARLCPRYLSLSLEFPRVLVRSLTVPEVAATA